jgi:zinc D-Ala-D-Ala carboxypeptidase
VTNQLTTHFKLDEFRCQCCGKVDPVTALQMAELLELVRVDTGPITIVSSFRCPAHNAQVGGVRDSMHLLGLAVDFKIKADSDRYIALKSLLRLGWLRVGIGKSYLHVDRRPTHRPVIWTYYD